MSGITIQDRKKELTALLQQMQEQPSRDWSEQRERVAVLTQMIAAGENGEQSGQQRG
jgi:hypothetical protein